MFSIKAEFNLDEIKAKHNLFPNVVKKVEHLSEGRRERGKESERGRE